MPSHSLRLHPRALLLSRFARITLLLALFLMASVPGLAATTRGASVSGNPPSADPTPEFAPGVVLVGLKPGVEAPSILGAPIEGDDGSGVRRLSSFGTLEPLLPRTSRLALSAQADPASPLARLGRIHRLHLPPGADVLATVQMLSVHPDVEFAEADYLAHRMVVPNDPQYAQQWALPKIGAPAAWDVTRGDAAVTIAIVDSGLDLTHQEFAGRLWINPGEVPGNGVDDDGNGKVDDVHGWDFVAASGDLADDNGHGTQVAGVIGAAANNGVGIAGLCWQCALMPITVMRDTGVVNYSDVARGVAYAIEMGARVINLSLGGYADSTTLRTAVESAATTAVLVAGAGNDARTAPLYPAAYPGVLAVAATDGADGRVSFSNYGDWVDLAAPGVDIQTTFAGANGYGAESGTSMASALVAGTAGLVVSAHPDWSPAQVRQQLLHTAAPLGGSEPLGSGRLRAGAALTTAPQPRMAASGWAVDGAAGARPAPGQSFQLVLTLENAWLPARNVAATLLESDPYVSLSDAQGAFGSLETGQSATNAADPFGVALAANTPYNHPIAFTVRLTGSDGYALDVPFTLTVRSGVEMIPGGSVFETGTTWTSDKSYVLQGNVVVSEGVTLTVEPGTQVRVAPGRFLRIDGTLIADGTAEAPIIFTTSSTTNALWSGLRFIETSGAAVYDGEGNYLSGSILRHVEISYAETGVNMLSRAPCIADATFARNTTGMNVGSSSARIERCVFTRNVTGLASGDGTPGAHVVDCTFSENDLGVTGGGAISLLRNSFVGNSGVAASLWGGMPVLQGNRIVRNGGGVKLYGLQAVRIERNLIADTVDPSYCWMPPCDARREPESALYMEVAANQYEQTAAVKLDYEGTDDANLLAEPTGVRHNTIIANRGEGLCVRGDAAGQVVYAQNNWFGNENHDFRMAASSGVTVTLGSNYWGGIPSSHIASRIYDCYDTDNGCGSSQSTIGRVVREGLLETPDQTAPAFVQSVSVSPDTVGLERATVEATFSRPMVVDTPPSMSLHDAYRGTLEQPDGVNCSVATIAVGVGNRVWLGCGQGGVYRYDGDEWAHYTKANSGLADDIIRTVFATDSGEVWFGHPYSLISRLQGTQWSTYTHKSTGGVLGGGDVFDIAEDTDGNLWVGATTGLARYDGAHWERVVDPSGMTANGVTRIARDGQGRMWFRCQQGIVVLHGSSWQAHTRTSGLPTHEVTALFADSQDRIWAGFGYSQDPHKVIGVYDDTTWRFFDRTTTDEVVQNSPFEFAEDADGRIWAVSSNAIVYDGDRWARSASLPDQWTYYAITFDARRNAWVGGEGGLRVLHGGIDYPVIDNGEWLSPRSYRATFDVTAEVPRGTYVVSVDGAVGPDGMAIAPHEAQTFTIDYAGLVSDDTPPARPTVTALGDGSLSTIRAQWASHDAESGIGQYRYAVGTTPRARDIRDWVYVSGTTTSTTLTGLLLQRGQSYYVTVAARNGTGLWSPAGVSNPVVAGEVTVYLPLTRR